MLRKFSFVFVLVLSIFLSYWFRNRSPSVLKVCTEIAEGISSASEVYFPGKSNPSPSCSRSYLSIQAHHLMIKT
jgi:hypothetical protein